MEQYLIDTNILSDYFSASLPPAGMSLVDDIIDNIPNLSVITQIELLCWRTNAAIEQAVKEFIADSTILSINQAVINYCVLLRKGKKIKTPDAIIGATALAFGYTLITNNVKDFAFFDELKTLNPYNR